MTDESVVLVDAQDNKIGTAEKLHAHRLGLLHRAFSVFILRKQDGIIELLLQQRNVDKYHCGGLWTNTCCSHPRNDEDVVLAAERRLQEEMGLHIKLQLLSAFIYRAEFANGLVEHEYDHVLLGWYNNETFKINSDEVQDFRWISLIELQDGLECEPQIYTPWLSPALRIVQAYCLAIGDNKS